MAYEAAQDRAATQVIGWVGQHATTRIGPRGAQVAVSVQRLDAVTVRHYTSRAGDPHRHLHLQLNARVWAAGTWRALDTVAFRDSINAINGIGHAAVACDPDFRAALAAHGYTFNPDGEIEQLAQFVEPFSRRAAQIGANIDRYESDWRRERPGEVPGPAQWRAWDAQAWAQERPGQGCTRTRPGRARPLARRVGRTRIPRPRPAGAARAAAGWTGRPRRRGDRGTHAAGCGAVGVERR